MAIDKARKTIDDYGMIKKGDRIVIGVSGGPDSMALLSILNALKEENGLRLFVAHLNHMIRGKSAEKDAEFVRRYAGKIGIPVIAERQDVPALSKRRGLSVEEAARCARYDFYLRTARSVGAGKIALGHTMDDQAETVLMRLIRGSGLLGLSGIPPVRQFEEKLIVRPLIKISKREIIKFLRKRRTPYRKDETNFKSIYFRNKIRRKLIPFLKKEFNPGIQKVLEVVAENIRSDYEYLLKTARKKFRGYSKRSKGIVKVRLGFLNEDLALRRMIIREAIREVKGDLNSISYAHWKDINSLFMNKSRWVMNLPDRVTVKKSADSLIFSKGPGVKPKAIGDVSCKLTIPGNTKIPGTGRSIKADFIRKAAGFRSKRPGNQEYFDFEKLKLPIIVRFRKSGDRFVPFGMGCQKRLKRFFIDEKVTFDKRVKVPLVVSRGRIIWVCGLRRADDARVTSQTKKILRLKIS